MNPRVGLVLRITVAGLVAAGVGLAVLLGYALSEMLANPGLSLVGGYWMGRLPWTAIGVDLVVIGATITAGSGTVTAMLKRRLVVLLPLTAAVSWWLLALIPLPVARGCDPCPPGVIDPMTVAYSSPEQTLLLLLFPAALIAIVALRSSRRDSLTA
jgi:hypothetical protein